MKIILLLAIMLLLPGCRQDRPSNAAASLSTKYQSGQVWQYKTRPGEAGSKLRIFKVEELPGFGTVIHVSVDGIHVRNPRSRSGFNEQIHHLPFAPAALDSSVVTMVEEHAPLPDYQEGYAEWKRNRGGVFTITVAEAIEFAERAVNQ